MIGRKKSIPVWFFIGNHSLLLNCTLHDITNPFATQPILKGYPNKESIFLMGGHDLEMEEIARILYANGYAFHDLNLEWGAKLSSYRDLLNDEDAFVGIELEQDIPPPIHYTEIDHHNEKGHLPSSLEQVATLLGLPLNREQLLIAANDSGYIPGMIKWGATKEEINEIRKRDRAAQGATDEDERLAEESIFNHLERFGDLIAVRSTTSRFSTIVDRLYPFHKLIVFDEHTLIYYGVGALEVLKRINYPDFSLAVFSGGGENGFWGIKKSLLNFPEILAIRDQIVQLNEKPVNHA